MTGLVYKSTGKHYLVKDISTGKFTDCIIKGRLRIQNIESTNLIAVGDNVEYYTIDDKGEEYGIIKGVLNRKNYLIRKSVNLSKKIHILAANIDYVFLVITLDSPKTTNVFVDRFLAVAQAYGIEVILVFNKIDLYTTNTQKEELSNKWLQIYQKIGYRCILTSTEKNIGIEKLIELMKNKVCMFGGHSGVGKSSIINKIDPSLNIKTAKLSTQYTQGKHTTSFAKMYDVNNDAMIIDTPGIRGFGVVKIPKEEIAQYFVEFLKEKKNCKYYNCKHIEEPNCAIKQQVELGEIAYSRYISYINIMAEDYQNTYR